MVLPVQWQVEGFYKKNMQDPNQNRSKLKKLTGGLATKFVEYQ